MFRSLSAAGALVSRLLFGVFRTPVRKTLKFRFASGKWSLPFRPKRLHKICYADSHNTAEVNLNRMVWAEDVLNESQPIQILMDDLDREYVDATFFEWDADDLVFCRAVHELVPKQWVISAIFRSSLRFPIDFFTACLLALFAYMRSTYLTAGCRSKKNRIRRCGSPRARKNPSRKRRAVMRCFGFCSKIFIVL